MKQGIGFPVLCFFAVFREEYFLINNHQYATGFLGE